MAANLRDLWPSSSERPDRRAVMQQAALIMAISAKDQGAYEAALKAFGDESIAPLVWDWSSTQLRPAWAVYRSGTDLVITFRGTTNALQWRGHISGTYGTPYPFGERVWVHSVHGEVEHDLAQVIAPYLQQPVPWRRIFVSGHSYGASLATLTALRLARLGWGRQTQCVTFGSPRVLTGNYEGFPLPHVHFNVMRPDDIICRTPPPWGSVRMIVPQVIGGVLARLGVGALGRLAAGQAESYVGGIGSWQHYGGRVLLADSDALLPKEDPEPPYVGAEEREDDSGVGFASRHYMQTAYWPRLARSADYKDARSRALLALGQELAEAPAPDDTDEWFVAAAPAAAQLAARDLTQGQVEVTPEQVTGAEVSQLSYSLDPPRAADTIGAARAITGGGAMPAWKFTAYVYWGKVSKTVSQHRNGPENWSDAKAAALEWVANYSSMLGSKGNPPLEGQFYAGTMGTPAIEYVRVSAALRPRISQRIRVPGNLGIGYTGATSAATASDFPGLAFSLQARAIAGDRVVPDTITFLGLPDATYQNAGYNHVALVGNGQTIGQQITNYLRYLLDTNSPFGTMGRDPNVLDKNIRSFSLDADGRVALEVPGSGWGDGDWVRVKGTRTPYLDRIWRVRLNANGTFTLKSSGMAEADLPDEGQAYLVRTANGNIQQVFYAYAEPFDQLDIPGTIKPTSRKLGKAYSPLVSRRPKRRPGK